MSAAEIFSKQVTAWGVDLSLDQEERLHEFARLLSSYDRANVIGTRDLHKVLLQHVLDSVSCLLFPEIREASGVVDVGSGGGLPGIPLALLIPDVRFTLIESTGKKASFLRYAVERLGSSNVEVVNARVEDVARDPLWRAAQDVCTVRAVAKLSVLAEYCLPLLRLGGHVIAMKGPVSQEEHQEGERAARLLGGHVLRRIEVPILRELHQKRRQLVVMKKTGETPGAYPRRVGIPAKNPLGQV